MSGRTSTACLIAILLAVPLAVACGGAAEEPAADNGANAPAVEPAPVVEPEPVEPEPTEPAEPTVPTLVGEIRVSGEDFEWGETNTENAAYTWTARVTNDTTATLDISVRFEFLDENDAVVQTETKTVRLDPAASRTLRESGNMNYDQANRVYSFRAVTDWAPVS